MVDTFASTLCMALTGDEALLKFLDNKALQSMQIAMEANVAEGLRMGDTTPEWIQAMGINYPFRRDDGKAKPNQDRQQDGNRR